MRMKISISLTLILIYFTFPRTSGFYVLKKTRPNWPTDGTHESITEQAVLNVIRRTFRDNPLHGAVSSPLQVSETQDVQSLWRKYYGIGTPSPASYLNVLSDITAEMENTEIRAFRDSAVTFSNEMINEGHRRLRSLQVRLRSRISSSRPDYRQGREIIAQYLFSIQKFYSNTNWVNLHGKKIAKHIGNFATKIPILVANSKQPTCANCGPDLSSQNSRSCENNLKQFQSGPVKALTSGYLHYQYRGKPTKNDAGAQMGKCGHGGADDIDRALPASGGINKETSEPQLSPHWFLHNDSVQAARLHTEYFLDGGNGTGGLRALLNRNFKENDDKFLALFGITYKPQTPRKKVYDPYSIGFVIDTTGSMTDDIENVKRGVQALVTEISSRDKLDRPATYVLTLFDDPVVELELETTDPNVILSHTNKAVAKSVPSNTQCEEMALTGVIAAMELMIATASNTGRPSTLMLFTDAPPRDRCRQAEVERLAKQKGIVIEVFQRTQCAHSGSACMHGTRPTKPIRVGRDVSWSRQNIYSAVHDEAENSDPNNILSAIAKSTGGQVHRVPSGQTLAQVLNKVVAQAIKKAPPERLAASSELVFMQLKSTTPALTLTITADKYLRDLFITVKSATSKTDNIRLLNPQGTEETYDIARFVIDRSLSSITLWVMPQAFIPGNYKLVLTTATPSQVEVIVEGDTDLTLSSVRIRDEHNRQLVGRPISDEQYEMEMRTTLYINASWKLNLVQTDGTLAATAPLTTPIRRLQTLFTANIIMPTSQTALRIQIVGTTADGSIITRELDEEMTLSELKLVKVEPSSGERDPLPGGIHRLQVNVTNVAKTKRQYSVKVVSKYPVTMKPNSLTLPARRGSSLILEVSIPRSATAGESQTLVISFMDTKNLEVNRLEYDYMVAIPPLRQTDTSPPEIKLVSVNETCSNICNKSQWRLEYEVTDTQTGIYRVGPASKVINYSTAIKNTSYNVIILVSCCELSVDLLAFDNSGNSDLATYKRTLSTTLKSTTSSTARPTVVLTTLSPGSPITVKNGQSVTVIAVTVSAGVALLAAVIVSALLAKKLLASGGSSKLTVTYEAAVPPTDTRKSTAF